MSFKVGISMSTVGFTSAIDGDDSTTDRSKTPGDGRAMRKHAAAVHINDGRQVHKASCHTNIGRIQRPDLVAAMNHQLAQHIRNTLC
jgi:hypothetical protein